MTRPKLTVRQIMARLIALEDERINRNMSGCKQLAETMQKDSTHQAWDWIIKK